MTYQHAVDSSSGAEFLVLDRRFPRSGYFSLKEAEDRLTELVPGQGRAGAEDIARRHLGLARAQLEFSSLRDLLTDLPGRLAVVQEHCSQASAAVAERYFRPAAVME